MYFLISKGKKKKKSRLKPIKLGPIPLEEGYVMKDYIIQVSLFWEFCI